MSESLVGIFHLAYIWSCHDYYGLGFFNLFHAREHKVPIMVSATLRVANEIQLDYADKPTFRDLSLMPVNDLQHGQQLWADPYGKGDIYAHGIVGKPGGLEDLWRNVMTLQSGAHAPKWMHGVTASKFLITDSGASLNAKECIDFSRSVGASAYATFVGGKQVNAMPGHGNSNISTALLTKACAGGAKPIVWVFGH